MTHSSKASQAHPKSPAFYVAVGVIIATLFYSVVYFFAPNMRNAGGDVAMFMEDLNPPRMEQNDALNSAAPAMPTYVPPEVAAPSPEPAYVPAAEMYYYDYVTPVNIDVQFAPSYPSTVSTPSAPAAPPAAPPAVMPPPHNAAPKCPNVCDKECYTYNQQKCDCTKDSCSHPEVCSTMKAEGVNYDPMTCLKKNCDETNGCYSAQCQGHDALQCNCPRNPCYSQNCPNRADCRTR